MPERRTLQVGSLLLVAAALCPAPLRAADVSSLYFFGDSLTDEGRAGRSAPALWTEALRADLMISAGANVAIAGATTHDQPNATFGDGSFLGQVHALVESGAALPTGAEAAIWIGTNDVWIGAARGSAPDRVAAEARAAVEAGIAALAAAGIRRVLLLGVYDLSLSNAYAFVGADTPTVRATAATASKLLNEQLRGLRVDGVTITFFDIAAFVGHLRSDAGRLGFRQTSPLRPGAVCDAACQQTSIFDDTIHLSARAQTLIGDYVASGRPTFNDQPVTYGAATGGGP